MAFETFPFVNHSVRHKYPAGDGIDFGGGYSFAVEPELPLRRTFILKFASMRFVRVNGVLSSTEDPENNLLALDEFYRNHRMDKRFNYEHEIDGTIVVRFLNPFEMPDPDGNNLGWSKDFQLELIEMP
jgi:hypothetical protein